MRRSIVGLILMCAALAPAATLHPSLRFLCKYDGMLATSGANFDLSGSGQSADASGGFALAKGMFGIGQPLNGSSDYIGVNSVALPCTSTQAWTVACWVKRTSGTGAGMILFYSDMIVRFAGVGPAQTLEVFFMDTSYRYSGRYGNTAMSVGDWHHIAATYSGTGLQTGLTLYVDGALQSMTNFSSGTYAPTGTGRFRIGTDSFAGACFAGTVDEVQIYAGALGASDVRRLATGLFPLQRD